MKRYLSILLLVAFYATAAFASNPDTNRDKTIVTTDWTIAETLLAIDAPLVGLGDKKQYNIWVIEPKVGENVVDLGSRSQPNLEALINLKPDQMINATWLKDILPESMSTLGIESFSVDFYTDKGLEWSHLIETTQKLASLVNKEQNGQRLIEMTEQQLLTDSQKLTHYQNNPYAIVQFIDSRHLRIYGSNSLYGVVLDKLNLKNSWLKPTNAWGFSQITLQDLAELSPDTVLIVIPPHPANTHQKLQNSALWQALPFSDDKQIRVLPAVWAFGALPSIQRFSQQLTEAIVQPQSISW